MRQLKKKKSTIKSNEAIGKMIETMVNERVKGMLFSGRGRCYDIETQKELIEVKSAKLRTRGTKRKYGQYMQTGRFVINIGSHKRLLESAKAQLKVPLYIFCIYKLEDSQPKIIKILTVVWATVDLILKGRNIIKRIDGLEYVILPHTAIFGGAK